MKDVIKELVGWIVSILLIVAVSYLIVTFVGQRTQVSGSSMETTLSDGDHLIVDKISYRFREPQRYEIVVFPYRYEKNTYYIKRIIGLPGETVQIKNGSIYINGELYYEDITLSQEEFYERLAEDADISTSQPAPADVMELWEELLESYDEVIHIPMSSGLSSSCETAMALAQEFDGKVHVIDNQRISVTQRQSVLDAIEMATRGLSAAQIEETLMRERLEASIYITVDTLKYLKKGGRITPAAAALGTVLNIKPVLQIQGEKLDSFAKVRGWKAAKKTMLDCNGKGYQRTILPGKRYIWKQPIPARMKRRWHGSLRLRRDSRAMRYSWTGCP